MCGINAIYRKDGKKADIGEITKMCSAITHRGPDGAGYALLNNDRLALGHVRLSIIDLHEGDQPIYNEDGSVCIVFNGEIYDYKELREELIQQGHVFRTHTDTEVIVHLYEQYGLDFVHRLNGEFAFIIWDANKKRMVAARDRSGVKPLYYHASAQEILISSEAKGIFSVGRVSKEMNPDVFIGPLLAVFPRTLSTFEHIKVLSAGHFLIVDEENQSREVPYWQPSYHTDYSISFDEAKNKVRDLFTKAVTRRMVADVPVGAYLSGGIDSTLVCGLMAERTKKVKAFSIGFGTTQYDESSIARHIAQHFGAEFETIDCNDDILADNLIRTLYHVEQPLANPNAIAKQVLSRLVRSRGYKVCLTGEGSDEIFGGYAFFKLEKIWAMLEEGGERAKQGKTLLKYFMKLESKSEGLLWQRGNKWRKMKRPYGYPSFQQMRSLQHDEVMHKLIRPEVIARSRHASPSKYFEHEFASKNLSTLHPFNSTRLITFNQLVSYIIPTLGDRVEMANSVECRTPFLDKDLFEYVSTVNPDYFMDIQNLREKFLLQKAFEDKLAELTKITGSFRKHPFLSPSWHSLAQSAKGKQLVSELISPSSIKEVGLFNPRAFKQVHFYWNWLPKSTALWKRVDVIMGMMLTSQALHTIFVKGSVSASAEFPIENRTWKSTAAQDRKSSIR